MAFVKYLSIFVIAQDNALRKLDKKWLKPSQMRLKY